VGCEIVRVGLKLAWRGGEGLTVKSRSRGPELEARGSAAQEACNCLTFCCGNYMYHQL
jgi:hypothetical protein